jgi:hypothetical protein
VRRSSHTDFDPVREIIILVLSLTLFLSLVGAGWRIYRRLPPQPPIVWGKRARVSETTVLVRLRRLPVNGAAGTKIEFYPVDTEALQREFAFERKPGQRFEDFLATRLKDRQIIVSKLDEQGRAVAQVPPGKWWLHATLKGSPELIWRLPVNISGRELIVELTPENAYARLRSF